ncbi:MAG: tryptophan synthase subunit alpha [Bacteroidota bacterium]
MNPFQKAHKQVSIFTTAGYPNSESLPEELIRLQKHGVDFIEIGIPFSDPMADGPVIQHTSSIALENGMTLDLLFRQLIGIREQITIPLVLMGYLNPVLQYGLGNFLAKCQELKIASLILPDLSYELYSTRYAKIFQAYDVPVTFLITPATDNERVQTIALACKESFVYLVGQTSITGNGYLIDDAKQQRYRELKTLCGETPLFLGFGIDSPEKRDQGFEECDGVIIGSAYLKSLSEGTSETFLENMIVIDADTLFPPRMNE